jgi:hypothetical protein
MRGTKRQATGNKSADATRLQALSDAAAPWLEGASIFDMVEVFKVMAEAHGCRHEAVRLSLEVLLASYTSEERSQQLARDILALASDHGEREPHPGAVYQRLQKEGLSASAANVLQVLLFGGVITKAGLCAWGAGGEATPPANLAPLLEWASATAHEPGDGEACGRVEAAAQPSPSPTAATGDASPGRLWVPVQTHATLWRPSDAVPALNVELVADSGENVVVLDGLVDEDTRRSLHSLLAGAGDVSAPPAADKRAAVMEGVSVSARGCEEVAAGQAVSPSNPPIGAWQQTTVDGAGMPRSWGMAPALLHRLERSPPHAVVEVQSRLALLYPEYIIAHMPSVIGGERQAGPSSTVRGDGDGADVECDAGAGGRAGEGDCSGSGDCGAGCSVSVVARGPECDLAPGDSDGVSYSCPPFVANAAVTGHAFEWHVDADPSLLPALSRWVAQYGEYPNGAVGRPLFVSLLVYTDGRWARDWHAETLFLEPEAGVGVLVQPRPGRAVLMHQDALHRVSAPSGAAGRPRYSLVWKLLFVPRGAIGDGRRGALGQARESVSRPEWGPPVALRPKGTSVG